jgi:MFS family permease
LSSTISTLGDQFTLVALPWLVYTMTGSSAAMGGAIALMGIPRAIFILLGGAVVDRYSPKVVLVFSRFLNASLLMLLAALVFAAKLTLPLLYLLALSIGLFAAFGIPAATSLLPSMLPPSQLGQANGIMMALRQSAQMVGPLLAGFLIAFGGVGGAGVTSGQSQGLAFAFAIDGMTFLIAAWVVSGVGGVGKRHVQPSQGVLQAMSEGLQAIWNDRVLRIWLLYWCATAFFVGMLQVALPVLASDKLDGVSQLGLMMGAYGAGALLGMLFLGAGYTKRVGTLGATLLLADAAVGLLLLPLGFITSMWQAALLLGLIGLLGGFTQVTTFSWIQGRVPRHLLGRAMSVFMFIFAGLGPLSAGLAGWLLEIISISQLLFWGGGALVLLVSSVAVFTQMTSLRDTPPLSKEQLP